MMRVRRWMIAGAALVPLAVAGLHTAYRSMLLGELERGFERWAEARRGQGWRIAHGAPERGGWPFEARLSVPDMWVAGGQGLVPGGVAWTAPRTTLRLALLAPRELVVEPEGAQRLKVAAADIPLVADGLRLTLPIEPGVPPRAGTLVARNVRAGTPAGPLMIDGLSASWESRIAAEGEPALTLLASAEHLALPPGAAPGLGDQVRDLAAEAVVTGPTVYAGEPRQRAASWRDGGGTLEIRRLSFSWGPAGVDGSATVALDEQLQPMGAATARITGASEVIAALSAAGLVPPRAARLAAAALPLMTRRGEDGRASVEVPLTLQDRTLALGRIPIARVPVLPWQAPP